MRFGKLSRRNGLLVAAVIAAGAVALGACKGALLRRSAEPLASHGAGLPLARVAIAACDTGAGTTAKSSARPPADDVKVRGAAQSGLRFVASDATVWQAKNNCYGCHVQAVTLEALVVGKKNRYDVPQSDIDKMLAGMFDIPGGAHGEQGLGVGAGGGLPGASKAFGGAAFAHYDEAIDDRVRKELLKTGKELIVLQREDGHVEGYQQPPVAIGELQATTQALQTWRQAYERTADEQWLAPMRRAETWIQTESKKLTDTGDADAAHLGYAIIGLLSAGASRSESTVQTLARRLAAAQAESGAWSGKPSAGAEERAESALATGLSLYALRLTGLTEADPSVARATKWLVAHQQTNGGWSQAGSARAEAMWAVLGLVTVDVLSVDVAGVVDGAHVEKTPELHATAHDNAGGSVQRMDLAVDDVVVQSRCGDRLDYALDTSKLGDGVHTIDLVATNARGQTSRRRVQVYAGAYFLTELGTRFEDDGTAISARDLAPRDVARNVELHVFATRADDGTHVRDREVWKTTREGAQGPVRFFWNGKDDAGKLLPRGSYVAELRFVRADGSVVQKVETPFVHDTTEVQNDRFGQVEGQLKNEGKEAIANAEVELVDKRGNVVQRVTSTAQGNYRFRNVDSGDYKVRVTRPGFKAAAAPVKAAQGAAAAAPIDLQAQ